MLPTYRNILVATDFTPNSDNAFKHAVLMARQHSARIHLLHVVPQVDTSMRSYLSAVMGQDQLTQFEQQHELEAQTRLQKELHDFVERELAEYPDDMQRFAGAQIAVGNPVVSILEGAKAIDADVIVMGTHSKGPLEHAFLGSVAEKVLHKSNRPVFVIPLPKE